MGTLTELPAWTCVEKFEAALPAAETLVDGVGILLVLTEDDERCRRDGVGCVAPIIWCVGLGSEMSMGRSEAEVEVEE